MIQNIAPTEAAEFWRWLANGTTLVSIFFIVRLVKMQDRHGERLDNHAQRLTKLDGQID